MSKPIRKTSRSINKWHQGRHRFEHWKVDRRIYFITARCRNRFAAFEAEGAKQIFWNRFDHYACLSTFEPWATTLLDNHYHLLGYPVDGSRLPHMMQRLHGSVAKLVNDTLPPRHRPFRRERKGQE